MLPITMVIAKLHSSVYSQGKKLAKIHFISQSQELIISTADFLIFLKLFLLLLCTILLPLSTFSQIPRFQLFNINQYFFFIINCRSYLKLHYSIPRKKVKESETKINQRNRDSNWIRGFSFVFPRWVFPFLRSLKYNFSPWGWNYHSFPLKEVKMSQLYLWGQLKN